ncbi:hypothetical protein Q0590_03105 [Rhodocytophaga aerolata]|jgi:hypothetical protein|uniref:Outer membrane protein beta-barrel domain-containing protein n=1 Tax=Rhodocytophaga aerolata TaxID=455078 RepID=A0ABT8QZE9_9BACT|nr:hypothetical protein [Rhodocytophaga aerolata]MDO1445220.1 hypothetical protein [Rhodocytophaga aerolata]
MKNKLSVLFALCLMIFFAQSAKAQYEKGDILINPGISIGGYGYYNYGLYSNSGGFLPLTINAEYSINDMFSVGGYAGYYSRTYKYSNDYKDRWTALSIGARGTLHASGLLNDQLDLNINEEKLDIYASLLLGFETYSWKVDEKWGGSNYYNNGSRVFPGLTFGARYFFTPKFGGYLELGRNAFGYLNLGVSFKL